MDFSVCESRNVHSINTDVHDTKNARMEKQLLIGSIAQRLDPRGDNKYTHHWKVYVRSADDEDLSNFVRKVVFRMHPGCADPIRILEKSPFELTNYSSNGFQLCITVLYHDAVHTCTIHPHELQLYSFDENGREKVCTRHERLETITFVNPSIFMKQCLQKGQLRQQSMTMRHKVRPAMLCNAALKRFIAANINAGLWWNASVDAIADEEEP